MSSITLTLSGKRSDLQAKYFPPIDLFDGEYECGLINLETWNSIHNITNKNNYFYFGYENLTDDDKFNNKLETVKSKGKQSLNMIKIPPGVYQIDDLAKLLKTQLSYLDVSFDLRLNKNTLTCELECTQPIDFSKPNSFGDLIGFGKRQLQESIVHISHTTPDISNISVIRVECNIIKGAYFNGEAVHTIHEFTPTVPPGYKIIEVPKNVIYFPVTVRAIHTLNIALVDQNNELIDFRDETITIRIHIRRV